MAILAVPSLIAGVLLVAASANLLPFLRVDPGREDALRLWGGGLTLLGLFAVGFGLPLFR